MNIIKNPEFVFDIHKTHIGDSSLSVIASTFIDSCSRSHLDLNKESPSGKLLFFREIHKYRKWVESYYSGIKTMKMIHQNDMNTMLNEESLVSIYLVHIKFYLIFKIFLYRLCRNINEFNINFALSKLYNDYVKKYLNQVEILNI